MASSFSELTSYLNEIGRYPVLTKEAQLLHCRAIHKWINHPDGKEHAPRAVARSGKRAMEVMMRSNLRLVVSIAKRYTNRGLDISDLIQEGSIGMMRSLELYDPARGYAFTTYAYWWIRQSITRAIHLYSRTIRLPVSSHETVASIFKFSTHYAATHGRPPTSTELAAQLNLTPERIRQVLDAHILTACCSLDKGTQGEGDDTIVDLLSNREESATNSPEIALIEEHRKDELLRAMEELPEVERYIIDKQYINKTSVQIISAELDMPRSKVLSLRSKALAKMKRGLKQQGITH